MTFLEILGIVFIVSVAITATLITTTLFTKRECKWEQWDLVEVREERVYKARFLYMVDKHTAAVETCCKTVVVPLANVHNLSADSRCHGWYDKTLQEFNQNIEE